MKITGKLAAIFLLVWGFMFGNAMEDTVHMKSGDNTHSSGTG